MKTKTIAASIIASLVLGLVATPAFAAKRVRYNDSYMSSGPTKYYMGVSGGQASIDDKSVGFDKTSTAFSFFGGYEINDNFAAELSYSNFGSMDLNGDGTKLLKSTAFALGIVGSLPVSQYVSIFGKLGYASTSYVVETNGVAGTTNSSGNANTAVGVNIHITPKTDIRVAYDTYKLVDAGTSSISNLKVASVGVSFKF
jgi:OOP family OmpA-OmpF porin